MSIVRWDPFRELEDMTDRLNRVFGRSALSRSAQDAMTSTDWAPAVDITETAEEFVVKADLPDLNKEDIKVSVEGDMLRISGERKQEKEEKNKKLHRVERYYGSFMRAFTLPDNVDGAKLQAKYTNGVLTVNLPKTEKAKAKPVDIKIS
jgi:HSP20 family protein